MLSCLEKTPKYFVVTSIPKEVFKYSKLLNGTLKLIFIFHDQSTRAISDFTNLQAKIPSNQSFDSVMYVDTKWEAIKRACMSHT